MSAAPMPELSQYSKSYNIDNGMPCAWMLSMSMMKSSSSETSAFDCSAIILKWTRILAIMGLEMGERERKIHFLALRPLVEKHNHHQVSPD